MLIYLQMIETEEDRSKFEKLYDEYKGLMYTTAYRMLEHEQDAEDAVHHAFLKIAENITKVGEAVSGETKSYVMTILENRAIDVLRQRDKHPEVALDEVESSIVVDYDGDDTLARCILQLPALQREMIWLKYRHGYSTREAAKLLGTTPTYASKVDQRAKNKLGELYAQEVAQV